MSDAHADLRAAYERARAGLLHDRRLFSGKAARLRVAATDDRLADLDGAWQQAEQHAQHSEVGLAPGQWCPACGEDDPCRDYRRAADLIGRHDPEGKR